MRLVNREFGIGDADLLETELAATLHDGMSKLRPVGCRGRGGALSWGFHSRYDSRHAGITPDIVSGAAAARIRSPCVHGLRHLRLLIDDAGGRSGAGGAAAAQATDAADHS